MNHRHESNAGDPAQTIRVHREAEYAIVAAAGKIDISTVSQLREPLFALAEMGHPLIVDLDQVSFIDATGLGVLVGATRRATAHGASLRVVCNQPRIRRLFDLTGLDRHVLLYRTPAEALDASAARTRPPAASQGQPAPEDAPG